MLSQQNHNFLQIEQWTDRDLAGDIINGQASIPPPFNYHCNIIIMARTIDKTPKQRPGLAKKAAEASAARLAARVADSEAEVVATPLTRTSPRRDKRAKNPHTQPSVASKTTTRANTPSQLVAESQSLLSPVQEDDEEPSTTLGKLLSVRKENVESQLTRDTDFPGDGSEPSGNEDDDDDDEDGGVAAMADRMGEDALLNFFENNVQEEERDALNEIGAGLDDLNDYSSDQFSLNERRHYFMDRVAISTQNRAAVEFVYMVEAETLTRDSGTRGLTDVKKLLHSKYIELIRQIPTNHFSEFGLREAMIDKYYGAKKGGAGGLYTKVLDVKTKVRAVTRVLDGIGTPLSKIPSGRGMNDVKEKFILDDYKSVMGAVSLVSVKFHCHHNMLANCDQAFVNQYADAEDINNDIPTGWWLMPPTKNDKSPKQSHFLLAAFVHKNNPDIVSDPLDAPAGASRYVVRKKIAEERSTEVAFAQTAQGSNRGKLEESMMSTKATLMKKNIELQETEGIEKQLNLMERFKSSFVNTSQDGGEREYDKAVRDMLDELPFMKKRKAG